MSKLFEGARAGDLEYLVSSFVSIDQYTSKIENDNIVISFFVKEKEPAQDLVDFISKNFFDFVIDIELAASKTINGDFQVFVELKRTQSFPVRLFKIMNALNILTNQDDWVFKAPGFDETFDLTRENIQKTIRLKPQPKQTSEEDIIEINIYGEIKRYKKVEISEYAFEQKISESDDFNDVPSVEYNEIAQQFPSYEVCMIDGTIYLIHDDKYYELIEQITPLDN